MMPMLPMMPMPPTPKRLSELTPAHRRRQLTEVIVHAGVLSGVLFAVYFLLPLEGVSNPNTVLRLVGGVTVFLAVLGWGVRRIKVSEFPQIRAIQALLGALPMFLLIPALLRRGAGFWPALGAGCILTMALYALMVWLGPRFGLRL